jgi:cytochrome c556
MYSKFTIPLVVATVTIASLAIAADDPRLARQELMGNVGDAAKPIGEMLQGKRDFDAEGLMSSLVIIQDASTQIGELFPPGSETGEETEAAPAIWEDRAGFDAAIAVLSEAMGNAIAAAPATLDAAMPVIGPMFDACKGCHETYRLEDD